MRLRSGLFACLLMVACVPAHAFAGNEDGEVLVFLRYAFTVTVTGKQVAMNMHHYFKFRGGKVCYVRSSEDTAQVTAALTP